MDSLRRPVGTLPPSVYWRRRLIVLAALVAVLALILYACSDSSTPKKDVAGKPVASGSASSTASVGAAVGGASGASGTTGTTGSAGSTGASSPAGASGATGSTLPAGTTGGAASGGTTAGGTTAGGTAAAGGTSSTGGTATTGGAVPAGACQLSLTLTTRAAAYANGEKPDFSVAVLNKGTADCTADLGPKSLVLTVYSGADRIWSSADCGGNQDLRAVPPGGLQQIPVTWPRVRSQPGCSGPPTNAILGTYYATATLTTGTGPTAASFTSQQQSFQLKTGS